jgi:hypothetical protein
VELLEKLGIAHLRRRAPARDGETRKSAIAAKAGFSAMAGKIVRTKSEFSTM